VVSAARSGRTRAYLRGNREAFGACSGDELCVGAGEGDLLLQDIAHERGGSEVHGVSAAQRVPSEQVVDEPVHVVVEGDAREGLKVRAEGLLPLIDHRGIARVLAPLAREGGDHLGVQELRGRGERSVTPELGHGVGASLGEVAFDQGGGVEEDDHRLSSMTISEAGLPATATGGRSRVEDRCTPGTGGVMRPVKTVDSMPG